MADFKPEDYFLGAADTSDDFKFLAAARQGNLITPLIDGTAFFIAAEEAMAAAKRSLYLAFWNIYADMKLSSAKVKTSEGVADWQSLLVKLAKREVKIRIVSSDFEAILANDNHQRGWKEYQLFTSTAQAAKLTQDQFQVFCSRHPAQIIAGTGLKGRVEGLFDKLVAELNKKPGELGTKLQNSPGIWPIVKLDKGKLQSTKPKAYTLFPATHHQKMLIIDGRIAFVGGINVSDAYWATPAHDKEKQRTHDLGCRVEGLIVEDLERNFVGRWNKEIANFTASVTEANAAKLKGHSITAPFAPKPLTMSKTALGKQGNALAQVHRTLSLKITQMGPLLGVTTERDSVAKAYELAISCANEFIYVENQYVRVVQFADWIIKRFTDTGKKLQVIIVVPMLPEELEEGGGDPLTQFGLYLQFQTLDKLRKALGANFGLYSLIQDAPVPRGGNRKVASSGSLRIYPHSKVMIVDDVYASVGSSNINPRGFQLDSEINVAWHEPASVKSFREQLWKEHLGSPNGSLFKLWKVADYVKNWDAIATKNLKLKPGTRQGFIIPHDLDAAPGKQELFPDFLV